MKHSCENDIDERVNGILKDELYFDQCFFSLKNAINIYNKRFYLSLKYKTPNMVFKYRA